MDSENIALLVGSGDLNAQGDASSYRVELGSPIVCDGLGSWEITLSNINYPLPAGVGNSVFVICSLAASMSTGSVSQRLLARLEPTRAGDPDPIWHEPVRLVWRNLDVEYINSVSIKVVESDGTPVPVGAGKFTTVEMLIRRIR